MEDLQSASQHVVDAAAGRRAFAIISHPDAGKTTVTEKFLLYSGSIVEAGAVKASRLRRSVTSDWMEMEKQRGISITSTVLRFEHGGAVMNLLDTPGHRDFSEDTYRVLSAADCALMVDRRRQGHRGTDTEALRGVPYSRHPSAYVHQQDGQAEPRPSRPAR